MIIETKTVTKLLMIHGKYRRYGTAIATNPNYLTDNTQPKYINLVWNKWAGLKDEIGQGLTLIVDGYFAENDIFKNQKQPAFFVNTFKWKLLHQKSELDQNVLQLQF